MHSIRTIFALALLVGTMDAVGTNATKSIPLPGHGTLRLELPEGWRNEVHVVRADLPPTITFGPIQGRNFEMLLTPIWPVNGKAPASEEELRRVVDIGVKAAQPRAIETQLAIKEVPGTSRRAFYFAATDRQPEPNGYSRMTQGAARVGELTVTFTILTNSGQKDVVDAALGMITGAEQVQP